MTKKNYTGKSCKNRITIRLSAQISKKNQYTTTEKFKNKCTCFRHYSYDDSTVNDRNDGNRRRELGN
jgi:hypothetical protein